MMTLPMFTELMSRASFRPANSDDIANVDRVMSRACPPAVAIDIDVFHSQSVKKCFRDNHCVITANCVL